LEAPGQFEDEHNSKIQVPLQAPPALPVIEGSSLVHDPAPVTSKAPTDAAMAAPIVKLSDQSQPDTGQGQMSEKEKLDYAHLLKLREMARDNRFKLWVTFLDKLILGGLIVAVTFIFNSLLDSLKNQQAQQLEDFRNKLAVKQFLIQKRFDALNAVMEAYNRLFDTFADYTKRDTVTLKDAEDYRKQIDKLVEKYNTYEIAIPRELDEEIEKHLFIHQGLVHIARTQGKVPIVYREFIKALVLQFRRLAWASLDRTETFSQSKLLKLDARPAASDRTDERAQAYFDVHFKRWQIWKGG
jgi:hypothetical protein